MSEGSDFPISISGTIPEASVRRLAEGVADFISPITEAAGMLGDSIRGHREAAAAKRIKAAMKRAVDDDLRLKPAPVKFIASWSDGASLEDDGSSLNELWENLLLSGLSNYQSHLNAFVEILRKFGPDEARCLKLVIDRTGHLDRASVSVPQSVEAVEFPHWLVDTTLLPMAASELWNHTINNYRRSPTSAPTLLGGIVSFANTARNFYYDADFQRYHVSFDLLRREGLVSFSTPTIALRTYIDGSGGDDELATYSVHVARLTQLGYSFARACLQPPKKGEAT